MKSPKRRYAFNCILTYTLKVELSRALRIKSAYDGYSFLDSSTQMDKNLISNLICKWEAHC